MCARVLYNFKTYFPQSFLMPLWLFLFSGETGDCCPESTPEDRGDWSERMHSSSFSGRAATDKQKRNVDDLRGNLENWCFLALHKEKISTSPTQTSSTPVGYCPVCKKTNCPSMMKYCYATTCSYSVIYSLLESTTSFMVTYSNFYSNLQCTTF